MALQWIKGDFKTGAITESAILPVVKNSDKIEPDINSGDSGTLTLSRADLPSDWRTFLEPAKTMVALVDTDLAFSSGVIWAGRINKAESSVRGTVRVQVTGLNQYLAKRIITSVFNTTAADPEAGTTFSASTWQGVMNGVIAHCFSTTGIPAGAPTPPSVLGTVSGSTSGTTYKYEAKNADAIYYADALDEIRDVLSPGNEYRFVPRWSSSAKTKIVWDAVIGTDSAPHIGEATTVNITLSDGTWKPIGFSQGASADNIASRIIGHSKYGEGNAGSDFTSKTSTAGTTILEDAFFNPGVELTAAEMQTQLTARLGFASGLEKEATFERAYETTADLKAMLGYLGNMAKFTGTGEAVQFGTTMRIVGLSFSVDKKTVSVSLLPKAAKYPKLPKDRRNDFGGNDGGYGGGGGGFGGTGSPVMPPPPSIPTPPPFTLPGDTFTEPTILEPLDIRRFNPFWKLGTDPINDQDRFYHYQPDLTRSRFNYETGELIGLHTGSRALYGFYSGIAIKDRKGPGATEAEQAKQTEGSPHNKDLYVFSIDTLGMFANPPATPYMNNKYVHDVDTGHADSFKKLVGTITYEDYSDLEVSPEEFFAGVPDRDTSTISRTTQGQLQSFADYNFFCTQDHQEIYVQIMVTTAMRFKPKGQNDIKSYSITLSKVLKGVRGADGSVGTWFKLGQALTENVGDETNAKVLFSPAIYEIGGSFKAFGGYVIPQVEDGVLAPTYDPAYELKFYQQGFYNVNPSEGGFTIDRTPIELPGVTVTNYGKTSATLKSFQMPYAVSVDYAQDKITLGISRGDAGKSTYFVSSLGSPTSFSKALETQREPIPNRIDGDGIASIVDPNTFSSRAPIFYKNNYIVFNGSETITGGITLLDSFADKKLIHVRGKEGFTDSVQGELAFPNWTNTGTELSAFVVSKNLMSHGNNLAAFGNYRTLKNSSGNITVNEQRGLQGLEYFVLGDFLYVFCDTTVPEVEFTSREKATNKTKMSTAYRYWVGKFRIKDELL